MLTNTFAAHTHGRIFALSVSTPRARPNSGAGLASVPAEMHCAAQAEYGRLAAQAYSPSDAMSQARFCLARMKKGSTPPETNLPGNLHAETGPCGGRIWSRGRGWSSRFSPSSATSLHRPMRRGRLARAADCSGAIHAVARKAPPVDCRHLFLARWIRLPRRHMGSRRRIGPDRLRHPRGLRSATEAQQPCEEIGAMLLKHRQDRFGGEGNLCVHVVMHSVRILTDGSGETASTPKIVGDVTACRSADGPRNDEAARWRPHRAS